MKDRKTYKILTIIGAFCGIPINRFYLGLTRGLFIRTITFNLFLIGAWADLLFMDKTFDEAMTKRGYINTDIRNKINKKPIGIETIEIPKGPIRVHVEGETWRKNQSDSIKLNTPIQFSLTPKCDYQKRTGWPEGEYYNVNLYPSAETTDKNWLGFISYSGKPTASQIAKLVDAGKAVSCWGEYEIEDDEVNIVITIPKQL